MTAERTTVESLPMREHPDLIELRDHLDRASETAQAFAVEGLAGIAGVYAAISPWVVGFNAASASLTVSNLIVGIAAALLAFELGTAYPRTHGMSWVLPVIGAWLVVSPWVVTGTDATLGLILSNVITGGVLVLLGIGAMATARMRPGAHS